MSFGFLCKSVVMFRPGTIYLYLELFAKFFDEFFFSLSAISRARAVALSSTRRSKSVSFLVLTSFSLVLVLARIFSFNSLNFFEFRNDQYKLFVRDVTFFDGLRYVFVDRVELSICQCSNIVVFLSFCRQSFKRIFE